MKVLDVRWFCAGHGNVGIVKAFDEYEGINYYVGQCSGSDADYDAQWVADWGSRFPTEAGNALFGEDELRNGTAVQIPTNEKQARLMVLLGERFLMECK